VSLENDREDYFEHEKRPIDVEQLQAAEKDPEQAD